MNDATLRELKTVVERAVRPVRASKPRKRKMREELLGHVTSVFQEELERTGDAGMAVCQATRRFGDPRELAAELQRTVPKWDRWRALIDWVDYQPGESVWRLVGKQTLAMLVTCVVAVLAVIPITIARGRPMEISLTLRVLAMVGVGTEVLWLSMTILTHALGRALYGRQAERSVPAALLCGAASLFVFPMFGLLTYWLGTGDLAATWSHMRLAACLAPATPLLFFVMSKLVAEEERYLEEWASLEIGE
jgi:hypothetical protein